MSVVTPTIISAGQVMDGTYQLVSIDVFRELNRIAYAQLILADGSIARQRFEISNTEFFEPGKEIEIKLRYESQADGEATVFKGFVIKHSVEMDLHNSYLIVDLKDAAVKLTQLRKSMVFRDQSDAEIIQIIAHNHGLTLGVIDDTQPQHGEIIQFNCTDWDFLLSRAEAQGLMVITDGGQLSARRINLDGEAAHRFEYGMSEIGSFTIEADASSQRGAISCSGWSIADQSLTPEVNANDFQIVQGNLQANQMAEAMDTANELLNNPVFLNQDELQAWADARLTRSRMAMVRGRLTVAGIANIKPMVIVEIAGIGERFNGKTVVTGVRHRVSSQGWITDIQFGLSPEHFYQQPYINDVPAAGLLPSVNGLRIGVVAPFEDDPLGELRVKTILPGLGDNGDETVWARLATPEAGSQHGFFVRPEPGDEVVIGFFNDDPRQAVILGAMFSSHNAQPDIFSEISEDNLKKGWVTKSGIKIELTDDEKSKVLIETPSANKIVLDDDAQSIEFSDQHGNTITLDSSGIVIKSASDLKIEASGNVEVAGSQVDIK